MASLDPLTPGNIGSVGGGARWASRDPSDQRRPLEQAGLGGLYSFPAAHGIAIAVRDSVIAIGDRARLAVLVPVHRRLATDPGLRRHLQQIGPMTAGLAIQDTTNLQHLPIAPWAGLGVLAAWAAAGLTAGGLPFTLRGA